MNIEKTIVNAQHGFVKDKSTTTNLLLFSNFLFESMDARVQVDVVYTDFQKAFDKVDHILLLRKLAFNGIKGNLLRWFMSYLDCRSQRVIINGHESEAATVTSGVIQGSILGPLLFIIFVNDITNCFQNSQFLMFADDLKIFKTVKSINDCKLIQEDLDRLENYCNENKIFLAYEKCMQISVTRNKHKIINTYNIGGKFLKRVGIVRDLGVYIDEKLILDKHIENIIKKAYKMAGFVLRISKPFKKLSSYLLLYKTLVRSQLEYASVVWNPYYTIYSERIERIQKKYLRAVHYRLWGKPPSYEKSLETFKLNSLAKRRQVADAVALYNICNAKYNCPELLSQIYFRTPTRRTRSTALLATTVCSSNAGERAPLHRICKNYNNDLASIDLFTGSLPMFRRKLTELLGT